MQGRDGWRRAMHVEHIGDEGAEADRLPTHARLAGDLRTSILSGTLSPGDALPTEHALAERYGTSRVTVRKALNTLCHEGLILSHQGKGYFVLKPEYSLYSMRFELVKPGHEIRFDTMAVAVAPTEARRALSLEGEGLVVFLQLTIFEGGLAVACEDKYLPYEKGTPNLESVIHYSDFPELADKRLARYELHCELRAGAELPDSDHARLLSCAADEPLLVIRRRILSGRGEAVGYGVAYLREEYGGLEALSGFTNANSRIQPR